jgi:hypothetical protein
MVKNQARKSVLGNAWPKALRVEGESLGNRLDV